jgi:hypothetical protein
LQQGSDNPRAARQGSDNPGADTSRASKLPGKEQELQGKDQTTHKVPGQSQITRELPGHGPSSVSRLPQAPEGAVVDESIVLTEVLEHGRVDPPRPQDSHSTVPSAIGAQPVAVAVVAQALTTAIAGTSSGSQRTPVRWGAQARRSTSNLAPTSNQAASSGSPTNLDEILNGCGRGSGT